MHLHRLLAAGLQATAALWPMLLVLAVWLHQAAHVLANHEEQAGAVVQARYAAVLAQMAAEREAAGTLAPAVDHFRAVTAR
jgi:hypothetical protein